MANLKEIKLSPTTQLNDIKHKLRHAEDFLDDGEKVKVSVYFKGRQIVHPETGKAMLEQIISLIPGVIVDRAPLLEGKNMSIILSRKQVKKDNNGKVKQDK